MGSVWQDTVKLPKFPALPSSMKTDVLIIGGGMAGILCASLLDQAGIAYVLVEANGIGSGVTQNTTAKITSQHGLIYQKLLQQFGREKMHMYLQANEEALENYRRMAQEIPCDFMEKDSYVYSRKDKRKIENELKALEKINFPAEEAKRLPLPFTTEGAIKFPNQAQFHPLKFMAGIAENLHIYEKTRVLELNPKEAVTNRGKIQAEQIIVATHFPFMDKHGSYFMKMYQHRSYVLALQNAPRLPGMYVDEADNGLSFRNYKDLLLLGGSGHRTGTKGEDWQALKEFSRRNYPSSYEKYRWATQDCMTLDGVPYIGSYSSRTKEVFVATGFQKWGMTSSMVAAMLLRDRILEIDNPYAPVFSPSRSMLRPQLLVNAAHSAGNLLTVSGERCPHMGCALKWNEAEQSWDCPCHGSRFTEKGKVINNPANRDRYK